MRSRRLALWRSMTVLAAMAAAAFVSSQAGLPVAEASSPPDAVSSVSVTRSDGSLTASWPAASGADYYQVDYSSDAGKSWSTAALRHPGTSITIGGVKNGASYTVRVQARNADGDSGWTKSPTAGPYTPPTLTAPGAPASVTVARGTFGQRVLNVSWSAVSGAGFYNVRYSDDGGQTWAAGPSRVTGTSAAVTGVNDSLPYYAAVQAENAKGASGWTRSSLANVECPEGHACKTSAQSPPDAPAFAFASVGNGTLMVLWGPVIGATKYEVAYSSDNGASWTSYSSNLTGTKLTISGVDYTLVYVARVRAGNSNGWSGWKRTNLAGPWSTERVVSIPVDDASKNKLRDAQNAAKKTQPGLGHGQPSTDPTPATYLSVSKVAASSATLTLHHYDGAWSYKEKSGGCVNKSSGTTTVNLAGLNSGTSYSYTAYPGSGCTAASMAFANFTTKKAVVTVTVSNLGETTPGWQLVGQDWSENQKRASGFTTGSNTGGYTLNSVTVRIVSVLGSPTGYTVAIHANSSGNPAGTATYTLTGDAPTGAGDYTYTCSGSCDLSASTRYFLVLSGTGDGQGRDVYEHRTTGSDAETNVPSNSGWSIDNLLQKKTDNDPWTSEGVTNVLKFKVTATVN